MNTTKITANKQKKIETVAVLSEKVKKAKALVFTNYQGLTHLQIEGFKKGIKKMDAEYAITKNRLMKRAVDEYYQAGNQDFNEPTATLFLYGDPIAPLKALAKMIKELQKPGIKFGIMDGQYIDDTQVIKLSTLPPKEVLLGQLAGMMQYPISGLHRALNWNIQKFVMTLSAIQKQKGGEN